MIEQIEARDFRRALRVARSGTIERVTGFLAARCVLLASLCLSACGDATSPDAGSDATLDVGMDAATVATEPVIPWLDEGTPLGAPSCPDGWHLVEAERGAFCSPYESGEPDACAVGEAHFVGQPGCAVVGAACPPGTFPADVGTDATAVFVAADADPGGDGSRARPYTSLSQVSWLSLSPDTTVALGPGSYEGTVTLRPGVIVRGACARATRLSGVDAPVPAVVRMASVGAPAELRDLTISSPPQKGVSIEDGGELHITGVVVEGASQVGVEVDGAGSTAILERVVLRGARGLDSGPQGAGLKARVGATVSGRQLLVQGNDETGVLAVGTGTTVTLEDVAVLDNLPNLRPDIIAYGRGLSVDLGASLSLSRAFVARNHGNGLFVWEAASQADLTDVVVTDTLRVSETIEVGHGISVKSGARLSATRLTIARAPFEALDVSDDSDAVVEDALLVDIGPASSGSVAGIAVASVSSRVRLSRAVIAEASNIAVWSLAPGAELMLSDVLVTSVRPAESRGSGYGLVVIDGGRATTERVVIEGAREAGIIVTTAESALIAHDLLVRDTLPLEGPVEGGSFGILVEAGSFEGERLAVRGASVGMLGYVGSVSNVRDLVIDRIERAACGGACFAGGYGLAVHSATAVVERFAISDVELCGVFLSQGSAATELDLHEGIVQGAAIGACLQVPGFSLDRLSDDVHYRDNGTNFDTDTSLPVPTIPML